jgi:hypothetical protein
MSRMPDEGGFELARAYMTVSADTGEATGEVDELEERAAELHGTLTIDADISPAEAKLEELDASLEGRGATLTVDAETAPAQESLAGLEAEADSAHGTLTEDADTSPAQAKLDELDAAANKVTGNATVAADIAPAEAELAGLKGQIDATHGDVTIGADVAPAEAELAALGETGAAQAGLERLEQQLDQTSGAADSLGESVADLKNGLGALGNQAAAAGGPLGDLSDKASVLDEHADLLAGKLGTVGGAMAGAEGPAAALADTVGGAAQDTSAFGGALGDADTDLAGFKARLEETASLFAKFTAVAEFTPAPLAATHNELSALSQELGAFNPEAESASADLEGMAQRLDNVRDAMSRVYQNSAFLRSAIADLDSASTQMGYAAEEDAQVFDHVGGVVTAAAGDIAKAGDAAADTGEQLGQASTGARLLDDAMAKAAKGAEAGWEAAEALNLSLADTDNIAEAAKSALQDLGATELEAAAGANALAKAQQDFDNLLTAGSGGGFGGGILNLLGGGGEEGASLGSALASVGAMSAGIGVAVAFAGAMAEVGGIVTGVSAAFTGLVPAVALAIPAFEAVKKAAGDSRSELEKLPPAERDTVEGIKELKSSYLEMAKAFEPDVFRIFNEGVRIGNNLLKESKPLADAAASGVEGLLKEADKFTQSQGFKNWLKQITPDIAPSIKAIGTTIGTIAVDWGKFMKTFSPKDIQTTFHILDNLINWWGTGWTHIIQHVMTAWDEFSTGFRNVKGWVSEAMTGFKLFTDWLASTFDDDLHNASNALDAVRETYITVGHDIEAVTDALVHETEADFDQIVSQTKAYWEELASETEADWNAIEHDVSDALDTIRESVVTAGHDIEAAFDDAMHAVESAWDAGVSDVEHITSELVHDIESAFTALPGELEHLGEEAIEGLAHGIEDAAGDVLSAIGHIASSIPSSLGKLLDMGSPSRVLRALGHDTMEGYRLGILDYEDPIAKAMKQVGTAAVGAATTAFSSHGAPVAVSSSIAPTAERAGGTNVTVNLNGIMSFPNPEQVHAIQMALSTAVGVSG